MDIGYLRINIVSIIFLLKTNINDENVRMLYDFIKNNYHNFKNIDYTCKIMYDFEIKYILLNCHYKNMYINELKFFNNCYSNNYDKMFINILSKLVDKNKLEFYSYLILNDNLHIL
jgi:hypothetical protein